MIDGSESCELVSKFYLFSQKNWKGYHGGTNHLIIIITYIMLKRQFLEKKNVLNILN